MTPEELLLKAAEDIATHGHHQGTYYPNTATPETAPVCAYGAMARAASGNPDYCETMTTDQEARELLFQAERFLAKEIVGGSARPFDAITEFNDLPSTTAEDVILLMKKAAELAREQGE